MVDVPPSSLASQAPTGPALNRDGTRLGATQCTNLVQRIRTRLRRFLAFVHEVIEEELMMQFLSLIHI